MQYLKYAAIGAILLCLPPLVPRAFGSLRRKVVDINTLMILAVLGAVAIGDYTEGAAVVVLFALSDWLEMRATAKVRNEIASLVALCPQTAVLADNGQSVPVEDLGVGVSVLVRGGDKVPVDGVVTAGRSALDESNLTGESRPIAKGVGDTVSAGTMNIGNSTLTVESRARAEDSAVSRLVKLVEDAQMKRSPTEQLVQTIAKYYTPAVVVLALLLASIPWAWGPEVGEDWLKRSLVLLVVACPCALVISTPITYVCGLAHGARCGILFKGGKYLESFAKIKTIAMDKTGTLTEGAFALTGLRVLADAQGRRQMDRKNILKLIASLERLSEHPIAAAMCSVALREGVEPDTDVADFAVIPGEGIEGRIRGRLVAIGNARMAKRLGWDAHLGKTGEAQFSQWEQEGGTAGFVGQVDGPLYAIFSASDKPRREAAEAVAMLKKLGVDVIMCTGDSANCAHSVARQLGVTTVRSDLLPGDKVDEVTRLKAPSASGGTGCCGGKPRATAVGMVGDGVNDAPALAAADVGIAMGVTGTVVAMETADVALMDTDLRKLAKGIRIGRMASRKIKENVAISLVTKLAVIVLTLMGHSILWVAIVSDVGAMLVVTLNGMTLLGKPNKKVTAKECERDRMFREEEETENLGEAVDGGAGGTSSGTHGTDGVHIQLQAMDKTAATEETKKGSCGTTTMKKSTGCCGGEAAAAAKPVEAAEEDACKKSCCDSDTNSAATADAQTTKKAAAAAMVTTATTATGSKWWEEVAVGKGAIVKSADSWLRKEETF